MTLSLPWRRGPQWGARGAVLVSVTRFQINRFRDLPGVYRAGLRLRRDWPTVPGAVGVRLWVRPWERRSGAISVWREESDLLRFLGSPAHVALTRAYRGRATVTSESWTAERFIAAEIRRRAQQRLGPL